MSTPKPKKRKPTATALHAEYYKGIEKELYPVKGIQNEMYGKWHKDFK